MSGLREIHFPVVVISDASHRAGGGAWCMLCGRAREQGSNSTPEARIPNSSPPPVTLTSRTNHEAADAALGTKGTPCVEREGALAVGQVASPGACSAAARVSTRLGFDAGRGSDSDSEFPLVTLTSGSKAVAKTAYICIYKGTSNRPAGGSGEGLDSAHIAGFCLVIRQTESRQPSSMFLDGAAVGAKV